MVFSVIRSQLLVYMSVHLGGQMQQWELIEEPLTA